MKIDLFFSSGVASKLHKAKRQEVEDSLIEVLKHAPHMPGGPKYKVIYKFVRCSTEPCVSPASSTSRHIKMITSALTKNIAKYLGVFNS
jgi:hypothetical protein